MGEPGECPRRRRRRAEGRSLEAEGQGEVRGGGPTTSAEHDRRTHVTSSLYADPAAEAQTRVARIAGRDSLPDAVLQDAGRQVGAMLEALNELAAGFPVLLPGGSPSGPGGTATVSGTESEAAPAVVHTTSCFRAGNEGGIERRECRADNRQ